MTNNNTITMDTIKNGNCQFNATSAKSFRATLAKWHNATFEITDELLRKNDRVKALCTLINSNFELIEKLEKGESIIGQKSATDLQAEIDGWNADIEKENANMAEYRKAQTDRLECAEKLVDKSIYEAYSNSINDGSEGYYIAIASFLQSNGIEPCLDTIKKLALAVGKKSASARQMYKNGKHNTTFSYQSWRKIFLGELCDIMGDTLPRYKFTYVLQNKRNKKADK